MKKEEQKAVFVSPRRSKVKYLNNKIFGITAPQKERLPQLALIVSLISFVFSLFLPKAVIIYC